MFPLFRLRALRLSMYVAPLPAAVRVHEIVVKRVVCVARGLVKAAGAALAGLALATAVPGSASADVSYYDYSHRVAVDQSYGKVVFERGWLKVTDLKHDGYKVHGELKDWGPARGPSRNDVGTVGTCVDTARGKGPNTCRLKLQPGNLAYVVIYRTKEGVVDRYGKKIRQGEKWGQIVEYRQDCASLDPCAQQPLW
ncbi:hypothetical protein [Streptomyces sp. NPDC058572]|uniref:hypothetical protein n=1 Tax=Streptomyces sp. NPDC058572 TaxID=3346546 RepID=UPI003669C5C0